MTSAAATAAAAGAGAGATEPASGRVPVVVAGPSWRSELRAVRAVWQRDLVRFRNDRTRIVMLLVQPLLFLFVLGAGLASISAEATEGVDLRTFLFPGTLCMAIVFAGMFSAMSVVMDRELGFLRELLVAPVRRSSILAGKCLGGASVAAGQGLIVLVLAPFVGVPLEPAVLLGLLGMVLVLAVAVTAFGVVVAVHVEQIQALSNVMAVVVFPLVFSSGALFPVSGLPAWLAVLNRCNPITYAVDPMRRLVFDHLDLPAATRATLDPGVTWWGWRVPSLLEVAIVLGLGVVLLAVAAVRFRRAE